jgi:hypothetical protein
MALFFSQPVYRIRIFSDFCESLHGKNVYEEIFETYLMESYGKTIYITTGNNYTHAIIWNKAMPVLLPGVPKENVVGLAYEPPEFLGINLEFIKYAQKYIGKYFIGSVGQLPAPFIGGNSYLSHMAPLKHLPMKKQKLMSIMVSQKKSAPGHIYRHKLVEAILNTNLPIDIYGRGCCFYSLLDARITGLFKETEPYEEYRFHICIENFQTDHYYSEKIINPLLCGTTPVYWGCQNIDSYFPATVYLLNGNLDEDMNLLHDIVRNPDAYQKKINVDAVKKQTNLLKNLSCKIFILN